MYILDADVLIDVQRKLPEAVAWFNRQPEKPAVCGLVIMELIQSAHNNEQVKRAAEMTAPLPTFWPTEADCRRALLDFRTYHLSHGLGMIDSLIAATAVGLGATLCTFNVKHYRVVPGLLIEQPYTRGT